MTLSTLICNAHDRYVTLQSFILSENEAAPIIYVTNFSHFMPEAHQFKTSKGHVKFGILCENGEYLLEGVKKTYETFSMLCEIGMCI